MNLDFWRERWSEGRLGWHKDRVHPHIERHLGWLTGGAAASVLVPLCGKTLDLAWLASRGHRAVGVEAVEEAARQLFAEAGLEPETDQAGRWRGGGVEVVVDDFFAVDGDRLGAPLDAVWDRASLVAIDPGSRRRYAERIAALAPGGRMLLSTFEYDQRLMDGPPFSVPEEAVRELYGDARVERLEREVTAGPPALEGRDWICACYAVELPAR